MKRLHKRSSIYIGTEAMGSVLIKKLRLCDSEILVRWVSYSVDAGLVGLV